MLQESFRTVIIAVCKTTGACYITRSGGVGCCPRTGNGAFGVKVVCDMTSGVCGNEMTLEVSRAVVYMWRFCVSVCIAIVVIVCVGIARCSAEGKPDILFILLDDHRQDAFSFLGHSFVETPNLDRLRSAGAWLENCFVTTSICCPSRATFLTGCYASRHGVADNETAEYKRITYPACVTESQGGRLFDGYDREVAHGVLG